MSWVLVSSIRQNPHGAAQVDVDPPPLRYLRSMGSLGHGWLKATLVRLGLMRRKRRRGRQG